MADTTPHTKIFFNDSGTVTEVSTAKPLPTTGSVSGTVAIDQGTPGATNAVVVSSSALPAGAARDGTDPVGTGAGTQAGSSVAGVGIRGWLSTLAGLFQGGLAQVSVRRLTRLDDAVRVTPAQSGTPTTTPVAQNSGSVTLLAANAQNLGSATGRTGVQIHNTSTTSKLYLSYATPAVIDSTQVAVVPPGGYTWTMPMDAFTSAAIYGIWDASGSAKAIVTEFAS